MKRILLFLFLPAIIFAQSNKALYERDTTTAIGKVTTHVQAKSFISDTTAKLIKYTDTLTYVATPKQLSDSLVARFASYLTATQTSSEIGDTANLLLRKNQNLSDLDDKATARGNLDVYSKTEHDNSITQLRRAKFVELIPDTTNPILSNAYECSLVMVGDTAQLFYAGINANMATLYYTYATDTLVHDYITPVATDLDSISYPYVFKSGYTYYCAATNRRDNSKIYLWQSTNKLNWTYANGGNPILTNTGHYYYTNFNPGICIVDTTWYYFNETCPAAGFDSSGIIFSYGSLNNLSAIESNTTNHYIIERGSSPDPVYVPDRNAILLFVGVQANQSGPVDDLSYELSNEVCYYASLDDDLSLASSWHLAPYFILSYPGMTIHDFSFTVLPESKAYNLVMPFFYGQVTDHQVYSSLTLNDFYDAITGITIDTTAYLDLAAARSTESPALMARGDDYNINIDLIPKGNGAVRTDLIRSLHNDNGLKLTNWNRRGIYINKDGYVGINLKPDDYSVYYNGIEPITPLTIRVALSFIDTDNDTTYPAYPAGVSRNIGGQLFNFGINNGSYNYFGQDDFIEYDSTKRGGSFAIDVRSGYPLFGFYGRKAGLSGTGMNRLYFGINDDSSFVFKGGGEIDGVLTLIDSIYSAKSILIQGNGGSSYVSYGVRVNNTNTSATAQALYEYKTGISSSVWHTIMRNNTFLLGVNSIGEYIQVEYGGRTTFYNNQTINDSLITRRETSLLADSLGVITLATGVSGWGDVFVGNREAYCFNFTFTSNGTVTLPTNADNISANISSTQNTVDKLNIYDAGSGIAIQNNLGAAKKVSIVIHYYTP